MSWLRVWHTLTAYHWRRNRRLVASTLGICGCGWTARFLRPGWRDRLRESVCDHEWGERQEKHAGPVGFDESLDTVIGTFRQCEKCARCEDIR